MTRTDDIPRLRPSPTTETLNIRSSPFPSVSPPRLGSPMAGYGHVKVLSSRVSSAFDRIARSQVCSTGCLRIRRRPVRAHPGKSLLGRRSKTLLGDETIPLRSLFPVRILRCQWLRPPFLIFDSIVLVPHFDTHLRSRTSTVVVLSLLACPASARRVRRTCFLSLPDGLAALRVSTLEYFSGEGNLRSSAWSCSAVVGSLSRFSWRE